jgi:hypothetical protein
MSAATIDEARELGASWPDIKNDFAKGYFKIADGAFTTNDGRRYEVKGGAPQQVEDAMDEDSCKYAKLAGIKRSMGTPPPGSQSAGPAVKREKAAEAESVPRRLDFGGDVVDSPSANREASSSSSKDGNSEVLNAIGKLTASMAALTTTVNDLAAKAVSKEDLSTLRAEVVKETKVCISEAVDPLKTEILDVRARLDKVEKSPGAAPLGSQSAYDKLASAFDPARRRVSFLGMPQEWDASKRVEALNTFMAAQPPQFRTTDIGNLYQGPHNDRKLKAVSYVEFGSDDVAREFLKTLPQGVGNVKLDGGKTVSAKPGISKVNAARNYALRKAEEMLKADPGSAGKGVTADLKERVVKVGAHVAFAQLQKELGGTFAGGFAHLKLP